VRSTVPFQITQHKEVTRVYVWCSSESKSTGYQFDRTAFPKTSWKNRICYSEVRHQLIETGLQL